MSRNVFVSFLSAFLVAALMVAPAVYATDYYWTGGGNDGLWSTVDNWALDAEGTTPADAAPTRSERASCHFDVPAGGLVVTLDASTSIVASNIVVTTTAVGPVEMKIVSAAQGNEFEFSPGGQITVGAGVTLVLNTAMGISATTQTLNKYGEGTLAFDLLSSPLSARPLVVNAGRVVVLPTSKSTRHIVTLAGTDATPPPVYENQLEGNLNDRLVATGAGKIQLNGKTMTVGDRVTDSSIKVTASHTIPEVIDSGTLSFANEHSYILATNQPSYNIELDRADVTYVLERETVLGMQFDDASELQKDDIGLGSRLVPIGEPQVANDADRGNVLSLDGSSGFTGPDANNGLTEFNPMKGFTLAMWLKPASDCNASARVFYFGNGSAHATAIALRLEAGNKIRYTHRSGYVDFSVPNVRGNWHHVAITYNGNRSYSFYLDGNPVALTWSAAMTADLNTGNKNFFLGQFPSDTWFDTGTTPYKGLVDDFFLSNRELSASEIAGICANGLAGISGGGASLNPTLQGVTAKSAGVLTLPASASVKTVSGSALGGGIELTKPGTTLTVGTGAGETNTVFQGTIAGTDSTLVKAGGDYTLTIKGAVKGVTNVVVDAGTLTLSRPRSHQDQGLVCRYSFDDPSNFGHDNGPAEFNMTKGDAGTPTAIAGVSNGAIQFPEVDGGYVYFESASAVRPSNFPSGNDSFTISTWIRPTTYACTTGAVICCWGGGGNGKMAMLRLNGTTQIMFVSSGTAYNLNVTVPKLDDGQWHHIVATYDGDACVKAFYLDGVSKGTATITGGLNVDTAGYAIEIGHSAASSSNASKRYRGGMDEFMVFDYAWSAEEVEAEYSSRPIPAPTVRWTFDGDDPLADTTGNYTLEAFRANDAQPDVTFESGTAICGKAARFTKTSGCLRRETFPEGILPAGKTNWTLVVRYRPDTTQSKDYVPRAVGWGAATPGQMFAMGSEKSESDSVQAMLTKDPGFGDVFPPSGNMDRTAIGSDHTRWYTVAVTYDKTSLRIYVDGSLALTHNQNVNFNLVGSRLAIGSSFVDSRTFYGLVDDVQIYNQTLSAGQVRMVAESLEASKGKATTDPAVPAGVLRDAPDVTVASGATLSVASTENIGKLFGSGTVEIKSLGRLNLSAAGGDFSGTVTGEGLIGIADDAVIEFGDGTSPLLRIDRPIALGANVTINTTATQGRLLLAEAESFIGVENLATWTATIDNKPYKVVVTPDGTKLNLTIQSGTILILM